MSSAPIDTFTVVYALMMAIPAGTISTIAMRNANICGSRTPYVWLANVVVVAFMLVSVYAYVSKSYDEARRARARIM